MRLRETRSQRPIRDRQNQDVLSGAKLRMLGMGFEATRIRLRPSRPRRSREVRLDERFNAIGARATEGPHRHRRSRNDDGLPSGTGSVERGAVIGKGG